MATLPDAAFELAKAEFQEAVEENKVTHARWLLGRWPIDVNQPFPSGDVMQELPLLRAVKWNQLEMVSLLLQHGADIEKRNIIDDTENPPYPFNIRMTSIHHALMHNYSAMTALLIASGADIEAMNDAFMTPLMAICDLPGRHSHSRCVDMLLDAGAQKNRLYTHKNITVNGETFMTPMTPLHLAIHRDKRQAVERLLAHNVIFEITEPNQQSVYWWNRNKSEIVRDQLQRHEANRKNCVAFAMCNHPLRMKTENSPGLQDRICMKTIYPEIPPEIFKMIFDMALIPDPVPNPG